MPGQEGKPAFPGRRAGGWGAHLPSLSEPCSTSAHLRECSQTLPSTTRQRCTRAAWGRERAGGEGRGGGGERVKGKAVREAQGEG